MAEDSRRVEIDAVEPKSRLPNRNEDSHDRTGTMTIADSVSYVGSTADHQTFLTAVFTISILLLVGNVLQWYLLLKIDIVYKLIKYYNYVSLLMIFLCFVLFLGYIYCFQSIVSMYRSTWTRYSISFIVVEFSGFIIITPLTEYSVKRDVLYSIIITCILPILSYIISLRSQVEFGFASDFIMLWTLRYYFFSFIGIRVVMAVNNPYGEIWFSLFAMLFLFLFILLFGLTLGNKKFFLRERPNAFLYSMLSYFNYVTMFANTLLLVEKLRDIPKYEI